MQKLTFSYMTAALGIIVIAIGIYMHFAVGYHGKTYVVIAIGMLALIAGFAVIQSSQTSAQKEGLINEKKVPKNV